MGWVQSGLTAKPCQDIDGAGLHRFTEACVGHPLDQLRRRRRQFIAHEAGLLVVGVHPGERRFGFAEAVEAALERIADSMQSPKANRSLEETVGEYLSKKHRDNSEEACPLASLGTELRHVDQDTRQIASKGVEQIITIIASHLPELPSKEAKARAHAIVAAMVGGMLLSRIVTDPKLSDSLLRDTKAFVLKD